MGLFFKTLKTIKMEIPDNLKFEYLLSLDNHIEAKGIDKRKETMKKIFEITKDHISSLDIKYLNFLLFISG